MRSESVVYQGCKFLVGQPGGFGGGLIQLVLKQWTLELSFSALSSKLQKWLLEAFMSESNCRPGVHVHARRQCQLKQSAIECVLHVCMRVSIEPFLLETMTLQGSSHSWTIWHRCKVFWRPFRMLRVWRLFVSRLFSSWMSNVQVVCRLQLCRRVQTFSSWISNVQVVCRLQLSTEWVQTFSSWMSNVQVIWSKFER